MMTFVEYAMATLKTLISLITLNGDCICVVFLTLSYDSTFTPSFRPVLLSKRFFLLLQFCIRSVETRIRLGSTVNKLGFEQQVVEHVIIFSVR